jgi:hypothetical protein
LAVSVSLTAAHCVVTFLGKRRGAPISPRSRFGVFGVSVLLVICFLRGFPHHFVQFHRLALFIKQGGNLFRGGDSSSTSIGLPRKYSTKSLIDKSIPLYRVGVAVLVQLYSYYIPPPPRGSPNSSSRRSSDNTSKVSTPLERKSLAAIARATWTSG